MNRSGGFLATLAGALAIFAVVYLLFGDSITGGSAGGAFSEIADRDAELDLMGAGGTGLETGGRRRKTAEEIAAEKAAAEKAAKAFPKEHGFYGTVTDGRGGLIQGAVVKLLPDPPEDRRRQGVPDGEAIASAATKKDGSFLVGPAPDSEGSYKLRAEAGGFAATIERVRHRGVRVDLVLDRGGALEVRVLDPDGKAIDGATVLHQAGSVVSAAASDEKGIARLAALPTGTGSLLVTKKGYGAVRDANVAVAPEGKEKRTLIMTRGIEITGTILDAKTKLPIEGASVSVRYQNLHGVEPEAPVTTEDDGRFELTAYVSGSEQMILRAHKNEYAEGRSWRNASAKGEVTIELHKQGEALTGQVLTDERQPVGGVTVTYASMGNEKPSEVPETTTTEDGEFTLPLPKWATPGWNLQVVGISDEHGIGVAQSRVAKADGPPTKPLEIELRGSGSVKGIVTDGAGQPVQGAMVSLEPDWAAGNRRAGHRRVPWQLMRVIYDGRHHNLSSTTGADGSYRITDVPAMEYKLTASFGLDRYTLPDAVSVEAQEEAEADVSLGEGGTIKGWVFDSEEKPIAGAYVYARPTQRRGGDWWRNRPTGRSQSDGRFVLRGVTDVRYHLHASASGYGSASEKNVSQGHHEVTLRLKARGWIDGVVYKEGSPYVGMFKIMARPVKRGSTNNRFPGPWRPGQQQRTFNTDDGKFKIRGLNAGDYTVQASTTEGLIAAQADVVTVMDGRASREARLDLQEGAVLEGTVRDDETAKPIARAWVYASARKGESLDSSGATSGNAQTDSKGKYEIKGLGGGSYTITVWTRGGSSFSQVVDLQTGAKRQMDLARLAPGTVQATVVDEAGKAVPDARIHVKSSNGNYINVNVRALQKDGMIGQSYDWRALWNTDATGVLMRYHIPPGDITIWATKSGYVLDGQKPTATVGSRSVTQVEIKLKKKK